MKIDYALVGSTTNPFYLDFWPIVSKIWKENFNITPILGLIGGKDLQVSEEYGKVYKFNSINNYDDGILSQLVRLYLPKYLKGNCIISDIDMIPLSKKYFIHDLERYTNNDFVVMSSHHPQTINTNQYPMCYVVGNSDNYSKLFNLDNSWESFVSKIPNIGWYTDQTYLYNAINENKDINYIFPKRENGFDINRIDRISWSYDCNKLKNDFYIDSHLLRPYNQYKEIINELINCLTK